jgi:hypothetical protein
MSDGNLRQIFQKHLPDVHWQGVETWSTGQGVPDMNGCLNGVEFWIENKLTSGWAVNFETGQIAWAERRIRAGGRVFLAVRRKAPAGPRKGDAADELWLFHGSYMREVSMEGIKAPRQYRCWEGGPAHWDWVEIGRILTA